MLRNDKFPDFGHPYNLFEYKIRVIIQITLCRNDRIQMDLLKNKHNHFSAEEAINYIPCTDIVLWVFFLPHASNFIMETEIIAYRDRSTIHTSSKLELLCQQKMTDIIFSQRSPSQMIRGPRSASAFFCFLCKTLPKRLKVNKINIYMLKVWHQKSTRTKCEICPNLTIKAPKRR